MNPVPAVPAWAYAVAREEVQRLLRRLPPALRDHARALPVAYETAPRPELARDGIAPDSLGMIEGAAFPDELADALPQPARIVLFLANLLDYAAGDRSAFRDEIRLTYLHELGHYLGLDEDALAERGVD